MDKTVFLNILERYASISVEEAKELAALRTEFPYSQMLQTLCARASKDHGFQSQQRDLQLAAVYASDRALLKDIVMRPAGYPEHQVIFKNVLAGQQAVSTPDPADVADVVMDDLERLSMLKDTFENLFMDFPESANTGKAQKVYQEANITPETPPESPGAETPPEPPGVEMRQETSPPPPSPLKSKKERIIEMAKAMNNGATGEGPSKKKQLDKDGNPVDELIAEIQSLKDEIVPENEKQKQQIEVINQFIRIQPSISSAKDRIPSAAGDLTPVKSGQFGDNIVSETLVEILIKQGKKDKAIEVLKKLIWKYPQKKAYFASQIEDLKK